MAGDLRGLLGAHAARPSDCANGVLYAFDAPFLDRIAAINPQPYLDIGTPAALAAAQQLLSEPWH